jgi:regulator of replication initiation timing
MSQETTQKQIETTPIMAQISLLNLRINDMMTQLNAVMKTLVEENQALHKENTELKEKAAKA